MAMPMMPMSLLPAAEKLVLFEPNSTGADVNVMPFTVTGSDVVRMVTSKGDLRLKLLLQLVS
jgi:hypothetical protein